MRLRIVDRRLRARAVAVLIGGSRLARATTAATRRERLPAVVDAQVRNDVVGGDPAGLGDDEAIGECGVAVGKPERAGVGPETGERHLTAELW